MKCGICGVVLNQKQIARSKLKAARTCLLPAFVLVHGGIFLRHHVCRKKVEQRETNTDTQKKHTDKKAAQSGQEPERRSAGSAHSRGQRVEERNCTRLCCVSEIVIFTCIRCIDTYTIPVHISHLRRIMIYLSTADHLCQVPGILYQ